MTDKQKELMAKYNRVAEDKSQLQQFCQEVIMGEVGGSLPEIESGDAGKVIAVNEEEDGYELQEVSGGTKLYQHELTFDLICTIGGTQYTATGLKLYALTNFSSNTSADTYFICQVNNHLNTAIFGSEKKLVIMTPFLVSISGSSLSLDQSQSFGVSYEFIRGMGTSMYGTKYAGMFYQSSPSSSPSFTLYVYGNDSVDLTTGEIKSRTNLASNVTISNFTDTVTEL